MTANPFHPPTPDERHKTLIAILLTCVAYGYFNIGDAALKMLAQRGFHFSQIVVFNCIVIIACVAGAGWWKEGKKAFVMTRPGLIFVRALLSAAVGILNILALPHIKLTTFYTLVFTSPLWVAVLAVFFTGEKLKPSRMAVTLAGFAAVAYVFRPGAGLFNVWALMIVVGAFFYSGSLIVLRMVGPKESRTMIITVGSLVSIAISLPFLPFHFQPMTGYDLGLFFMMGLLGAISVTCIAYAFQNAPAAAVVAPFHYTQIVWGTLLGYYLFGEVPDDRVILGAGCIIAAGLYLIFSETRRPPVVRTRGLT